MEGVRRYAVLNTPAHGSFDRITALAARIFDVPMSIVSVVDVDRVWFMSHHGTDAQEAPRGPGLCASAILDGCVWVCEDAAVDPRVLANPLVAGDFGLRFYAGAPLTTSDGCRLGTLCVLDRQPRRCTPSEMLTLADLAALVVAELELRLAARRVHGVQADANAQAQRIALTDHLTGVPNRRAFEQTLASETERARAAGLDVAVAMIDIDGLKLVNDQEGHGRGDLLLQTFARSIRAAFRSTDMVYRIGGDEFTIVAPLAARRDVEVLDRRITSAIDETQRAGFPGVGASVGVALLSECNWSPDAATCTADKRMYANKNTLSAVRR